MFRFNVLLALFVMIVSPAALAHTTDAPVKNGVTGTLANHGISTAPRTAGKHYHEYTWTETEVPPHGGKTWYYFNDPVTVSHLHHYEDSDRAYKHTHETRNVQHHTHPPRTDPKGPQGPYSKHPHQTAEHQHDNYVPHFHAWTHNHRNLGDHDHTDSWDISNSPNNVHNWDNNHSGVQTRTVQQSPPDRSLGAIGPEIEVRRLNTTNASHSHSVTHEHGSYTSHTHTVTHTGDASQHTHSYTQAELHALDNNHDGIPLRQPTTEQPTTEQPTTEQPTTTPVTTPATTPGGGGGGGGGGETSEETSSPQKAVSSGPQVTLSEAPPARLPLQLQPLRVTEYMVRDWSKGAVIGNSNLPQWIELYNPNTEAVSLRDYTFQYATRRFRNQPYKIHTLTLAATEDGFSIPGGGVALLATQRLPARKFSGIETTQVYNLNIENVLKRGWVLTDADGKEIQRIGREAFSALRDPVAPRHQDGTRVSYHAYLSEKPTEAYYYGDSGDIGSPGFYEQPPPAAPSKVKRKRFGTWAALKK